MKNISKYLIFISLISAMGGLLFGYDWVVIGGAKIFYEQFFDIENSPILRGWAMSSALIGCLLGAILSGRWSDKWGRKKMLIISAVLFIISAYGTGAVNNFSWFIFYRIVGGFGIGIASNISPIYIAEVAPAKERGSFVSLNQLTIVIGILMAQLINLIIGDFFTSTTEGLHPESIEMAWRWMFWAEIVPASIFFALAFIIPESPRWLIANQQQSEGVKILNKIGGEEYANQTLENLQQIIEKRGDTNYRQIFKDKNFRPILLIGIVLAVFQQWCGINVIFNYAHEIFSSAGYKVSDVLMNIVITGVINLVFTFVAIKTVDKWGRRKLMLMGSLSLAIIYTILGSLYFFNISGWPMLLLVVMAIACYAMSLAPVVWVVLSEIFPVRIRGMAMAISTFCLWFACFVLTYTFPILNEAIGAYGTFWIYGIICFSGYIFIKAKLPETKGKSLEELEKEMTRG